MTNQSPITTLLNHLESQPSLPGGTMELVREARAEVDSEPTLAEVLELLGNYTLNGYCCSMSVNFIGQWTLVGKNHYMNHEFADAAEGETQAQSLIRTLRNGEQLFPSKQEVSRE